MQNENKNMSESTGEIATVEVGQASLSLSPSSSDQAMAAEIQSNFINDISGSDEDISEVESFILDEDQGALAEPGKFLLSSEVVGEGTSDLRTVDPETQARLEALLEAAGIGKLSTADGKDFADPEVLRRLTSSVSCALDEAAAALTRMRAEQQGQQDQGDVRSLAEACSDGDIGAVRKLLDEGRSVHETTEEGESLLSLACSAGYYELAQVLLAMRANVEDRGIKGDCTPLMEASSGGYFDIVKLLIAHGADVNAQSSAGNTPLHYAACGGYEEVVRSLLEAHANVEEHNENGHTPLMEASSAGHVGVSKILLEYGAGINTHSNEFKESALTLACYKGHLEMVKYLLDAGADQEHKTDEMHTALMEASMDGHVEVARLLLDSGAQVNMPPDSFESPLTLAACGGHVELASLLMERGANLEEVNDEGYTALMEASREGHEEMVALLLAHGGEINAQTEETQETALTLACCGGFLEVADFLISTGADLELGCSTPLMEASQEGHLELVRYLLKAGANVHAETSTGDTALTYACENGHTDVADILLQHGAELEHESEGGRTPLMKSARAGHLCTVQFLISKGADVNRSTLTNDHTVLSLACAGGHMAVVELLLANGADPAHKLKDGSTMLIEASKGGHTTVVNLLLDYPSMGSGSPSDVNQMSLDDSESNEPPRVPIQGLNNIVPPHDPNDVSSTSANFKEIVRPDVPAIPGQVDLKDLNILPRTKEEIYHNMQQSLSKSKWKGSKINHKNTTAPPPPPSPATSKVTSPTGSDSSIRNTSDSSSTVLNNAKMNNVERSRSNQGSLPDSLSEEDYEYNYDQNFSDLIAQDSDDSTGGENSDDGSRNLHMNYGEIEHPTTEVVVCPEHGPVMSEPSVTSEPVTSQSADTTDPPGELKASERLEVFINKMMRKAELLNTTREEQIQKKQQILEELQKVERELQEKAQSQMIATSQQRNDTSHVGNQLEQHQHLLQQKEQYQQRLIQLQQQYQQKLQQQQWQQQLQEELTNQLQQQLKESQQQKQQVQQHEDQLKQQSSKTIQASEVKPKHPALPLHIALQEQLRTRKGASKRQTPKRQDTKRSSSTEKRGSGDNVAVCSVSGEESTSSQENGSSVDDDNPEEGLEQEEDGHPGKRQPAEGSAADDTCSGKSSEAGSPDGSPKHVTTSDVALLPQKVVTESKSHIPPPPPPGVPSASNGAPTGRPDTPGNQSVPELLASIAQPENFDQTDMDIVDMDMVDMIAVRASQESEDDDQPADDTIHKTDDISCNRDKIMFGAPAAPAEPDLDIDGYSKTYEIDVSDEDVDEVEPEMNTEPELVLSQQQQLQLQQLIEQQQRFYQISDHLTEEEKVRAQQILHDQLKQLHQQQMKNVQNLQKRNSKLKQQHHQLLLQQEQLLHNQRDLLVQEQKLQGSNQQQVQPVPVQPLALTLAQLQQAQRAQEYAATQTLATVAPPGDDIPVDEITPPSSAPLTPNPSPASPQATPPIYPHIDLDAQTESNHDTALTLACAGGHSELVNLLLSRGAEIEHRDKKGFTPLILAATAGHSDIVEILIDSGADIEAQSERTKDTPLSLACSGGRYEVVELLLARGANKEHRNVSDYTPLSLAASGGYVNIIKLLLSHGAEINSRTGSKLGISPLMLAAMNGHTAAVKLLLDMGSDINAQIETNRNTALTLACFQGRHEVVSLLVDRKANIEHRAKTGLTPLMEAASGGYVEVGRVLLDKGADVNAPPVPSSRDTALTIAADKGHYRFVELLLLRYAAVDVKNKKGNSPLWLACNGGHLDVVQLLVKAHADIDSQDNRKVSCLMAAFRKGHIKVVKWMVRHVNQFPSDQECMRYTATITDKDLLKKCHNCMEIIVSAKDRQAAEANKNATYLLEELEMEKSREENKKAAAARKRERKKQKKKEKMEKEREEKEKEDENTNPSPEPDGNVKAEKEEGKHVSEQSKGPISPLSATTTTTIGTAINTDTVNINNKRNSQVETIAVSHVDTATKNKNKRNRKDRDQQLADNIQDKVPNNTSAISVARPSASSSMATVIPTSYSSSSSSSTVRSSHHSSNNIADNRKKRPVAVTSSSSTGIGDLDDFGSLPSKYKLREDSLVKKERTIKSNRSKVSSLDSFGNIAHPSPNKSHHGTTPTKVNTISPKRGHKREEGWKEVIRKSKKVMVPASAMSRVIGRAGCNINAIREVSGANIDIDKPKGTADRVITIKGSADATRQAHNLITALVKDPDKDIVEIIPKVKRPPPVVINTSAHVSSATPSTYTTTTSTCGTTFGTMNIGVWSQPATVSHKVSGGGHSVARQISSSTGTQAWTSNPVVTMSPRRSSNDTITITTTQTGMSTTLKSPSSVSRKLFQGDSQTNLIPGYKQHAMSQRGPGNPPVGTPGGGFGHPGIGGPVLRPPQPIGSKPVCSNGGQQRPHSTSQLSPLGHTPNTSGNLSNMFSPFNNHILSQAAEQVYGKKDEQDRGMNFATVAASGVLGSFGSKPAEGTLTMSSDLNVQMRSHPAPDQQRNSKSVMDPGVIRAPGYRSSLSAPASVSAITHPIPHSFSSIPEARNEIPNLTLGKVTILTTRSSSIQEVMSHSNQSTNFSPRTLGIDMLSSSSQYTTPDQPMTLPRIESTLNPNAPAFSATADQVMQSRLQGQGYMPVNPMMDVFGQGFGGQSAFRPLNTSIPPPSQGMLPPRIVPGGHFMPPPPSVDYSGGPIPHPTFMGASHPGFMGPAAGMTAMGRAYSPSTRTPVSSPRPATPPVKNSPRSDRTSPVSDSPPGGGSSSNTSSPIDQLKHNVFERKPMPIGGERSRRTPTGPGLGNMGNLAEIWGFTNEVATSDWLPQNVGSTNTATVITSSMMSEGVVGPVSDRPSSQPAIGGHHGDLPSSINLGYIDPSRLGEPIDQAFQSQLMMSGFMPGIPSLGLSHSPGDGLWNNAGKPPDKNPKTMWNSWSNA